MATIPFRVDEVIASLINDMTRDEIFAFILRHEHPKTDEDVEILAYACLQSYIMFGCEEHREKARSVISNRVQQALPERDEAGKRRDLEILEFIEKSVVKGVKDIGEEGSRRAERLLSLYNAKGGGGPGRQENNAILSHAIIAATTSVAFTPPQHGDRAARLAFLGNLHGIHYMVDKQKYSQHLQMAILFLQMAVEVATHASTTPQNREAAWMWHVNLSTMLGERYKLSQKDSDLDEAILVAEQVRQLAPSSVDTLACDNVLTGWLLIRYKNKNRLQDLDRFIEVAESAVVKCKRRNDSSYGIWLVSLAASLARRFEHAQSRMDVDRAVEMAQLALEASTPGAGHRAEGTSILGYSLMLRSTRSGRKADLDESLRYADDALKLTQPGDLYLGQRLARLGACYIRRFEVKRDVRDVQLAIDAIERALEHANPGTSERPTWLDNLSLCYSYLAGTTLSEDPGKDRDRSVELAEQVLQLLPEQHAQRAAAALALGSRYLERYEEVYHNEDAKRAKEIFLEGWNRRDGPTDLRIASAQHAAKFTSCRQALGRSS